MATELQPQSVVLSTDEGGTDGDAEGYGGGEHLGVTGGSPRKKDALHSQSDVGKYYDPNDHGDDEEDEDVPPGCGCKHSCFPAEVACHGCGRLLLRFNPVVFGLSIIVIWAFVIWAVSDPKAAQKELGILQSDIVASFTWLYNGSLVVFMMFCAYLTFSEYGDLKLGRDDEEPEYSLMSWFAMLFSAGIGIGLFFFGVGEPVAHFADAQSGGNRFANLPLNEQATAALNLTWFHWGFAASSVYCVVGLPLAFFAHRKGLPMTIRTCFYSLFGEHVKGPVGDILDALAVIGTMFGVATSLGLGVLQLSTGLNRVNPNIPDTETGRVIIIWCITAIATVSVVTGLDVGIRRLSEGNFLFGLMLLLFLFFAGGAVFQLDLLVQTAGYHLQWLLKLMFHTDAWARDGFNGASFPTAYSGAANTSDPLAWMSWWSVFYWAWWIAWSPFVGVFIATISKGRTVRQFILGNVFVPTVFTSVWLTIFGGLGIRQEMRSQLNGYTCDSTAPLGTIGPNGSTNVAPEFVRLSCRSYTNRLFDLIDAFPFSNFISVITIISLTTYFVTSSDSASHVIDVITCNGRKEPPVLQRIFWAMMEGAVACALLVAGGPEALSALQTASIAAGLPFTFVLIMMMIALKKALDIEMGYIRDVQGYLSGKGSAKGAASELDVAMVDPGDEKDDQADSYMAAPAHDASAKMGDDDEAVNDWTVNRCAVMSGQVENVSVLLGAFFLPCCLQIQTQMKTGMYNQDVLDSPASRGCSLCLLFGLLGISSLLMIIFGALRNVDGGYVAFSAICALIYWSASAYYRMKLRYAYNIYGSIMGDCCAYLCFPVCTAYQEAIHVETVGEPVKKTVEI